MHISGTWAIMGAAARLISRNPRWFCLPALAVGLFVSVSPLSGQMVRSRDGLGAELHWTGGAAVSDPLGEGRSKRGRDAPHKVVGPAVAPGAVGSAAVMVPRRGSFFRYSIQPGPGIRVYGALTGEVRVSVGEEPIVPIAYGTPPNALAGPLEVATVTVEWRDGSRWSAEIESNVQARPRVALMVRADREEVVPGGAFAVQYTLVNQGNSPDTVQLRVHAGEAWEVERARGRIVIGVGQRVSGTLQVRVPDNVASGEVGTVRVYAEGRGNTAEASTSVRVARSAGLSDDVVWIPTRVYLGTTVLDPDESVAGALGFGLEASGKISSSSGVSVSYHPASQWMASPGLSTVVGGSRFRAELQSGGFRATVGNVFTPGRDLTGFSSDGRGVQLRWDRGAVTLEGTLARPRSFDPAQQGGHVAEVLVGARSSVGLIGVSLFDREQAPFFGKSLDRLQGAGLRYEVPRLAGRHGYGEVGVVRLISSDGEDVVAPIVTGSYSIGGRVGTLWTHFRGFDSDLVGRAVAPGIASGGGSLNLFRGLSVSASGHTNGFGIAGDSAPRAEGATAGVRMATRLFESHLTGRLHRGTLQPGVRDLEERRSVTAALGVPLGSLRVQGEVEHGATPVFGVEQSYSTYRTSVRWSRSDAWAWLGLSHTPGNGTSSPPYRADMNASVRLGPLELRSGAGASFGGQVRLAEGLNLWSGMTLQLFRNTAIMMGADYLPMTTAGVPWRISLGFQRRLSLPLPIPTPTAVSGVVFDDLNGDGQQDPGEPGVQGIRLFLGGMSGVTDSEGRFSIRGSDIAPSRLVLDAASLPSPLIRHQVLPLNDSRRIAIPLVRPATLFLELRVEDARTTDGASIAAEGSVAELRDRQGRVYPGIADVAGRMTFSALAPGEYTLAFWLPTVQGVAPERKSVQLTLRPGEQRRLVERVPVKRREIRMRSAEPVAPAPEQTAPSPRTEDSRSAGGASERRASSTWSAPPTVAERRPPLEEASQVYQSLLREVPAPSGIPDFQGALHRFEAMYVPQYADAGYADQVRSYLVEMIQRVAPLQ